MRCNFERAILMITRTKHLLYGIFLKLWFVAMFETFNILIILDCAWSEFFCQYIETWFLGELVPHHGDEHSLSPYGVNSWLEKISFEKCRCFVLRFLGYIGHQHIPVHRELRPEIFCVSFLHKDKVKLQPKNRRSLVSLGSSQKIHFALAPTFQFIIWTYGHLSIIFSSLPTMCRTIS